jgi:hypothetical protein
MDRGDALVITRSERSAIVAIQTLVLGVFNDLFKSSSEAEKISSHL